MDSLTKALSLYEIGCWVLPAKLSEDGTKVPLLENGHLDASNDPEQIHRWFAEEFPNALVGVHAGRSGLVLLDRDIKTNEKGEVVKNGFESLENEWLLAHETVNYPSIRGAGRHDIYLAPENVVLNGQADYRKMPGVDRRGGSSWWVWAGDTVPDSRDAFAPAPEWLCDPATVKVGAAFDGGLEEWLDGLVHGKPNRLVRAAMERIPADMGHSEMVERQLNAIRLGAEGAPGVPELLEKIRDAWMNRPEENHTTPKDKWAFKFDEALSRGIQLYGEQVDRIRDLPTFDLEELPSGVKVSLLLGEPGDKYHFSKVLNNLIQARISDDERASILWNAPTTKDTSREWGIDFVYQRIATAHNIPEPERENPYLEEVAHVSDRVELLTEYERGYIATRPTFIDVYAEAAESMGFANPVYTRSAAWVVASMAFAFRGFIPVSETDKMGVNIWNISLGESGTGKTRAIKMKEALLDALFTGDNGDSAPYHTSGDNSPEGLHLHLLQRDRKPTALLEDEASGFISDIREKSWMKRFTDSSSDWYEGKVRASSKLSLKEFRGKTALTSFHVSMMATPDRFFSLVDDQMFLSGFLARTTWDIAPPPPETDDRFTMGQAEEVSEAAFDEIAPHIRDLAVDLVSAARMVGATPKPILTSKENLNRMERAYKKMYRNSKTHPKWAILEPSITRLAETMRKCAAICAMYRGDTRIRKDDVFHAIHSVEIWYNYLVEIVDQVAQGEFQKLCNDMEFFIRREVNPTETKILNTFRNRIKKDPRELDTALRFLVDSGRINREAEEGKAPKYAINGGK